MGQENENNTKIYTQAQVDSIMDDFKTSVLPQIKTAIEARQKKSTGVSLVTLLSAPTSDTLQYTIGSGQSAKTYDFKIGDEVRVADQEAEEGYKFYKLYDITGTAPNQEAVWGGLGSGGGGSVMGKIRVNLRAYVNDVLAQGTDLNGAEVTLTNTTNNVVVDTLTWAGTTLIFADVTPMKAYSISVSAKTGYTQPAAQTIAELAFSADETLNFDYMADEYTASIQSNQGTDSGVDSARITIAGTAVSDGGKVKVAKGTTITPTASDITGYRKTVSTSGKIVTALYETEILSLTVSADDSSDVSAQQVTVTNTSDSSVLGTLVSGQTLKIAYGTAYKLSAASLNGYTTPADVTATASQTSRSVSMEYVYNPIMYAYVTIDQSQSGETSMITVRATENGSVQTLNASTGEHANAALQALRDSSHLYMGTFANSKMTLRQLKDNDGTKYLDGITAKFDGTEGDHFLRIGEPFYIKRTSGSDSGNQVTYGIAVGGQPDNTWKQIITPNDLLGVHEAYIASSMLYSRSGVQSGASQTRDTFKTYARNRGTGFTCVTWEWHCVMALLFYAWYGRTNAQAQCGTGSDSYTRTLGTKDSFGMTDTTSSNGNADNTKFWGIENWWGDKYEWVDNADVSNYVWTITNVKDGTTRNAGTAHSADGWINKLMLSSNLDLIPTGVGGSETTCFCDYYYRNTGSRVVARSYFNANPYGGVAFVLANRDSSYTYGGIGSRLAFNGTIEIA